MAAAAQADVVLTNHLSAARADDGTNPGVFFSTFGAPPVGAATLIAESIAFRDGGESDVANAFASSDFSALSLGFLGGALADMHGAGLARANSEMSVTFTLTGRYQFTLNMRAGDNGHEGALSILRLSGANVSFFDRSDDQDGTAIFLAGILEPGDYLLRGEASAADSDRVAGSAFSDFVAVLQLVDLEEPAAVPAPGSLALLLAAGAGGFVLRRQAPAGARQPKITRIAAFGV